MAISIWQRWDDHLDTLVSYTLFQIEDQIFRLHHGTLYRLQMGEEEIDLPSLEDFPPLTNQLSSSAPALPVWPADVGEGPWALPNQSILPEDSRPRPSLPEVHTSHDLTLPLGVLKFLPLESHEAFS